MADPTASKQTRPRASAKSGGSASSPYSTEATVEVFLNEDGELDADPKPVRVEAGGHLTFMIDNNDKNLVSFVVLMKKSTPFRNGRSWAGSGKQKKTRLQIHGKAHDPNGSGSNESTYSYSILASDGTGTHYMDPDVIVGPPPTS